MPFILQDQHRISGSGIKRTTDLYNTPERERESHDPSVSGSCGEDYLTLQSWVTEETPTPWSPVTERRVSSVTLPNEDLIRRPAGTRA